MSNQFDTMYRFDEFVVVMGSGGWATIIGIFDCTLPQESNSTIHLIQPLFDCVLGYDNQQLVTLIARENWTNEKTNVFNQAL